MIKNNKTRSMKRTAALLLALFMLVSFTGCSIRNSHVTTDNVLVESGEDETIWVDDGVITSEYSDTSRVMNNSSSGSSGGKFL